MIVRLSQEEIEEYDKEYDGSLLEVGEPVYFDGEMYFTSAQLSEAIWRIEGSLSRLGDPLLSIMKEDLAQLKAAHAMFDD